MTRWHINPPTQLRWTLFRPTDRFIGGLIQNSAGRAPHLSFTTLIIRRCVCVCGSLIHIYIIQPSATTTTTTWNNLAKPIARETCCEQSIDFLSFFLFLPSNVSHSQLLPHLGYAEIYCAYIASGYHSANLIYSIFFSYISGLYARVGSFFFCNNNQKLRVFIFFFFNSISPAALKWRNKAWCRSFLLFL